MHRLENVFAKNPLYFVTCCTANRRKILAAEACAIAMIESFRSSPEIHGWAVGRYVVMPDHVHFFARPSLEAKPLSSFVRDWKKWSARAIAEATGLEPPIWQAEFFDHVLRSADSYSEKWEYVRQNPVRAGLVATPDDWRYTGECEILAF